jgi:hypothetical protein
VKTQQKQPTEQMVWRLTQWDRYEPEELKDHPGPLPQINIPVSEEEQRDVSQLTYVGGGALLGVYVGLLELAGDRNQPRGYLLTPDGRPATAGDLAAELDLQEGEVQRALPCKSDPSLGRLEAVPFGQLQAIAAGRPLGRTAARAVDTTA